VRLDFWGQTPARREMGSDPGTGHARTTRGSHDAARCAPVMARVGLAACRTCAGGYLVDEPTPGAPSGVHVETAPPDPGVVVLSCPAPPRAPSLVLVPRPTFATVADGRPPARGPTGGRTNVPGTAPRRSPVLLASPDDQEVAMLTEALGLLEWTAIGASVAAAMAALAVTLHAVLSRGR